MKYYLTERQQLLDEMQRIVYYRRVYVCFCLSVCMPRLWTPGKRFEIETSSFFFKLRGLMPDITCKSFTQIGLQIPRWQTIWRAGNTIIGRNSAIYLYAYFVFLLSCA